MTISDPRFITKEIADYGESVTVREISKSYSGRYRDATETPSDHTSVPCMVSVNSSDETENKEGELDNNRVAFYFSVDYQDYLTKGNRIYWNSQWYEIDSVFTRQIEGTDQVIKVIAEII